MAPDAKAHGRTTRGGVALSDPKPPGDLEAMISLLRNGGVFHAEFHADGSIKVLTLGPAMMPPETPDEDGQAEPDPKVHPLKEAAKRLAFGMPRTKNA